MLKIRLLIMTICVTMTLFASTRGETPEGLAESSRFAVTLLTLYRDSDAIYIARFDKKEDGQLLRAEDGYMVNRVKTHFTVISALKGDPAKLLELDDEEFRYRLPTVGQSGGHTSEAVFVKDRGSFDEERSASPGDKVLLFLRSTGPERELALVDHRDGIKRLGPEDEQAYIARIKELGSILTGEKFDAAAVAAWLVRCAEEPATRWEGAFELERGFRQLDWKERTKRAGGRARDGEGGHAEKSKDQSNNAEIDLADVAAAVTPHQRGQLTNALLSASYFSVAGAGGTLPAGDIQLLKLVRRWSSREIAAAAVQRLKYRSDFTTDDVFLMNMVAEIVGDRVAVDHARKLGRLLTAQKSNAGEPPMGTDQRLETVMKFIQRIERPLDIRGNSEVY